MMRPAFRKSSPSTASSGDLPGGKPPRWDLKNLYPALDSPELRDDRKRAEELIGEFKSAYENGVGYLSGEALGAAVAEYEEIEALRCKISSYCFLLEQENSANIPKTEAVRKWLTETADKVSFFEGEIYELKEPDLIAKLAAPELAAYAAWLAGVRADKTCIMEGNLETVSRDLNAANAEALRRLYSQTMAELQIVFGDKKLSLDQAASLAAAAETKEDKEALRGLMGATLKKASGRVGFVYNNLVKSQAIDDRRRGYSRPDQEVNLENRIEPEVVDAMEGAVKGSYARLSQRYFTWRNAQNDAPASELVKTHAFDKKAYPFGDAKKLVLRAFRKFAPRFARIAQKFFDEEYIDAEPRPGKTEGGFMMPTGPDNFPYILINYTGKTEDVVSSLGHELGHGVHQVLAEKARGSFLSEMPTAIAETASIFAEMLVFEELLRAEKDPRARKLLLSDKLEHMLDNSLRQVAYYDFEKRVHAEALRGEVAPERLSDIWVETQKAYFGPSEPFDLYDRYSWMVISHFFDTPFYVYSYAFAQVAVSGLFQAYQEAERQGPDARDAFVANYIELLETGLTKNLYETFLPFDMDPETPEFWEKGLSLMEKYMDELSKPDAPAPGLQEKFNRPQDRPGLKSRKPGGPRFSRK